jgi:hypothetical protein
MLHVCQIARGCRRQESHPASILGQPRRVASLALLSMLIASWQGLGAPPGASEDRQSLELILESPVVTFSNAEMVEVQLTLLNRDSSYWVFLPYFLPEEADFLEMPKTVLSFEVTDELGRGVDYVGRWTDSKIAPPTPADYLVLTPTYYFGRTVALARDPFAYHLEKGKTYSVRATLDITGRTWVENQLRSGAVQPEELRFDPNRLFEGVLRSNSIVLSVAAGEAKPGPPE